MGSPCPELQFTRNHQNSLLLVDKYGQMAGETSMNGFMVGKWWLNSCNLQAAKLSIIPLYIPIYLYIYTYMYIYIYLFSRGNQ